LQAHLSHQEENIMIGKKNVAFGFLFLVLTAVLGPYMVGKVLPDVDKARMEKQAPLDRLQQLKENSFEENLQKLPVEVVGQANTDGVLALNKAFNAQMDITFPRSVHAHGNLEAILNILAGLALCFIAVARLFKQVISWLFIMGAVLHSGMLYMLLLGQDWAGKLLLLGPWTVLAALLLLGVATIMGFKGEVVKD
jgi:hypothetical protein